MSKGSIHQLKTLSDYETAARNRLTDSVWGYYSYPGEGGQTFRDNMEAFKRYRLLPRNLRDVSARDTTVTVMGTKLGLPVAIAPTACHIMAHPGAELATAKGAASMNTGMVLSSWAGHTLEEVSQAAPRGVRWFYLMFLKDRRRMKELLDRAERAGYAGIFLPADQPYILTAKSTRPSGEPALNLRFPVIFEEDPCHTWGSPEQVECLNAALKEPGTWEDVAWVRRNTKLPIVLKGVLSVEDALTAVRLGMDGIGVSNHGGRELDGVPAAIDVLPDIVRAVDGKAEVYLDGGVRTGTDVLKALALGARCVFIGRPSLWGLACNGAEGVQQVLQILKDELSLAMARTGCAKIADINPSLIVHESFYLNRHVRAANTETARRNILTSKY